LSGRRCVDFIVHDPDAVLCTSCDNTLNSIAKCEQKLAALKKDILEKVPKAMGQGQRSSYCRKRSVPPTHSAFLPATKATRGGFTSSDSCDAPSSLPATSASVECRATATDYQSILSSPPTHVSSGEVPLSSHQLKRPPACDKETNAPSTGLTSSSSVVGHQTSPVTEVS